VFWEIDPRGSKGTPMNPQSQYERNGGVWTNPVPISAPFRLLWLQPQSRSVPSPSESLMVRDSESLVMCVELQASTTLGH
jgi:hypothetical protein